MTDRLHGDEQPVEGERGDGGEGQLGGRELGAGLGRGEGRQDEAEDGEGGDGGEGRTGALGVEDGHPVAQGADEQGQADDSVAGDHDGGEDGVPGERGGLVPAVGHQGDDEGHFDDGDGDGEDQGPEGFTDPEGDDLGVVDGRQHRAREAQRDDGHRP